MNKEVVELFDKLNEKVTEELKDVLDKNAVGRDDKGLGSIEMPIINKTADDFGYYDDFTGTSSDEEWLSVSGYIINPIWNKIIDEFSEIYIDDDTVDEYHVDWFLEDYADDEKNAEAIKYLKDSIEKVDEVIEEVKES